MPPREYHFWVDILSSRSHTPYTGVTNNLRNRVLQHRAHKPGTHTTRYKIDRLVYYEHFEHIRIAIAREKELKHWTRAQKIALIESTNPTWEELLPNSSQPATIWFSHFREKPKLSLAWIALAALLVTTKMTAQGKEAAPQLHKCSQQTLDKLGNESDTMRDWTTLRAFFHRYNACQVDDAEVTGGVSESVARILVDHWETLPEASKLFKQDRLFERFALAGINITDLTDDLNRIDKLAAEHCPINLHALCQKIRRSVRDNN